MAEAPIHLDLGSSELVEIAIQRGEGRLGSTGSLVTTTGQRSGRSPADRFIVDEPSSSDSIDWGSVNRPISAPVFEALWNRVLIDTGTDWIGRILAERHRLLHIQVC